MCCPLCYPGWGTAETLQACDGGVCFDDDVGRRAVKPVERCGTSLDCRLGARGEERHSYGLLRWGLDAATQTS